MTENNVVSPSIPYKEKPTSPLSSLSSSYPSSPSPPPGTKVKVVEETTTPRRSPQPIGVVLKRNSLRALQRMSMAFRSQRLLDDHDDPFPQRTRSSNNEPTEDDNSDDNDEASTEFLSTRAKFSSESVSLIFERELETFHSCTYISKSFMDHLDVTVAVEDNKQEQGTTTTATSSSSSSSIHEEQPNGVRFSDIHIREYPIILGDNPGGVQGPPLTIAWDYLEETFTFPVDQYEAAKEMIQSRTRTSSEMRMTSVHRHNILRCLGFSNTEIAERVKEMDLIRKKRMQTHATLKSQKTHEAMESVGHIARSMFTFGLKQRRERAYLKKNCPSYCSRK